MEEERRQRYNEQRRRRREKQRMLRFTIVLLVLAAIIAVAVFALRGCAPAKEQPAATEQPEQTGQEQKTEDTTLASDETEPSESETEAQAAQSDDWRLILVNATHLIPEDYSVTLKELRNDNRVDERIYPELQEMFDDARADGVYPLINESYRTAERQQQIMDQYIAGYEAEGDSHEEAVAKAEQLVAAPGCSEHQLGLALDIVAEYDDDSTATWNWLLENSWRYGFILRYPEDKVEITGISYEPWHFRYVGKEAAQEITEQGLCLEEYLGQ